jgi:hypothetical protein
MLEALRREPELMLTRPMLAARINAPMSQKDLLTRAPQRLHRRLPGAGKIAHGFVSVVWNPDWREFTRA